MTLWWEALGATLLAGLAAAAGAWLGRRRGWRWAVGYGTALLLVLGITLARRWPALGLLWPLTELMRDRREFLLLAVAIPLLGTCLLPRLTRRRLRWAVAALTLVATVAYVLPAYWGPALWQRRHQALRNRCDVDGICWQRTGYTCVPAAAVTALHRLGLPATEGELAILARTSPLSGTDEDLLAAALARRYRAAGLRVERRPLRTLADLAGADAALVVIPVGPWTDHFVAVLQVTPDWVVIGNPSAGRRTIPPAELLERCRPTAILLYRTGAERAPLTALPGASG